jgi:hypothetical protein
MSVFPRLTFSFAWLLAAVLVMTQTFAAMHGVVHADRHSQHSSGESFRNASHAQIHEVSDGHHHADTTAASVGHSLSDLFSLHQEESDCRLFDQASHDGALAKVPASLLPMAPPPFTVALFQGNALARWAALFDARGPPLTV